MIQAWLLTPLFLLFIALGWGLLVDRAAGSRLPRALIPPVGFAAYVVGARLLTATQPTTGTVATVVAVLVAAGGLAVGWPRLRAGRIDPWALAAVAGVFLVFAAPVVLSGKATFAGYGLLGDNAFHFVLADALMNHHGNAAALPDSGYRATAESYRASGYPVGAHAALGVVRPLTGQDVAWIYQPFLAFVVAMLALSLVALLRQAIPDRRARALAAFVAAQPALVYSFALQGSIKELGTLWLIPLIVALVAALLEPGRRLGPRAVVPLTLAAAAAVSVIGPAAALWLVPVLVVTVALLARRAEPDRRAIGLAVATATIGALILSLPTLAPLASSLDAQGAVLTAPTELGNLVRPLRITQVLGVYLSGDYRLPPTGSDVLSAAGVAAVLSAAVFLAALVGLAGAVRRCLTAPLLLIGVSALALVVVLLTGSPWAVSKAIAIASPAVLVVATIGCWTLAQRRDLVLGAALTAAVVGGVVLSNAFAYHGASLAPRDRLQELSSVGHRLDGRGPTLSTEFDEFTKYFARDARAVAVTEAIGGGFRPRPRPGAQVRFGFPVDLDELEPDDVQRFPAILVRRSPDSSRPPFNYRRTWMGRYYEIWQRRGGPRSVLRLPLGTQLSPDAIASCGRLRAFAARASGRLLVAPRGEADATLPVARRMLPSGWATRSLDPTLVTTVGSGLITGPVYTRSAGTYRVWLRGSINRQVSVQIDGRTVGSVKNQLAQPAEWNVLGTIRLGAGRHSVRLYRGGGTLAPGNGDENRVLGPVTLTPARGASPLLRVPVSDYRRLCGRTLDWVEAVPR